MNFFRYITRAQKRSIVKLPMLLSHARCLPIVFPSLVKLQFPCFPMGENKFLSRDYNSWIKTKAFLMHTQKYVLERKIKFSKMH